eukprot:5818753-Amphidinium_carterae.1
MESRSAQPKPKVWKCPTVVDDLCRDLRTCQEMIERWNDVEQRGEPRTKVCQEWLGYDRVSSWSSALERANKCLCSALSNTGQKKHRRCARGQNVCGGHKRTCSWCEEETKELKKVRAEVDYFKKVALLDSMKRA